MHTDIYYYLIPADKIEEACRLACQEGEPNELFQVRLSTDGLWAAVQARWTDLDAMDRLGTRLGKLLPNGQAEPGVYEAISGPLWESPKPERLPKDEDEEK